MIEASPLFDREWYLRQNPDVPDTGLSAAAHYLLHGRADDCNPGPAFDNREYLERYPDVADSGINPLLHFLRHGAKEGRRNGPDLPPEPVEATPLDELMRTRLKILRPLRAYTAPSDGGRRVTLLTDSVSRGSLFGGVGTAIIFATLLAERLDAVLRIATQTEPADAAAVATVLRANAIAETRNVEFVFTDREGEDHREIDLHEGDLFLTTSWWTTANALAALSPRQIIYFLQEDERLFYPNGDEYLLCEELLRTPGLRFVVNSKLLHSHLAAAGLAAIARDAPWFEPAFPNPGVPPMARNPGQKQTFLFYARPWNGRNLYLRGLQAICAALEENVLDPQEWDFCFVGRDLSPLSLPRDVQPALYESLPWPEYRALVQRADLGLTLMYTPHPSYPPLDLAAAGAVVVTNRFGIKTSLACYSPNILCVEPSIEGLVAALADGATLAGDLPRRHANHARNGLSGSWQENFRPVLDRLAGECR